MIALWCQISLNLFLFFNMHNKRQQNNIRDKRFYSLCLNESFRSNHRSHFLYWSTLVSQTCVSSQLLTCVCSTEAQEQINAGPPEGKRKFRTCHKHQKCHNNFHKTVLFLHVTFFFSRTKHAIVTLCNDVFFSPDLLMFRAFRFTKTGFIYHVLSFSHTGVRCVWFCFLFILTMRKNALHHELLSTWHQSPERATDRPASQEETEECLPLL